MMEIQSKMTGLWLQLSFFDSDSLSLSLSLSLTHLLSVSPEIRGEVNQMVSITDKIPTAVEKNKLLLPPNYNRYFMWGFPDYSARIATVEGDKVSTHSCRIISIMLKKVKINVVAKHIKSHICCTSYGGYNIH